MSFRSRSIAAIAVIAAAAPLFLLLANSDWFFTREGYLDPWNYVGLFRAYTDPDYLPQDYKLARLPWILIGALVHGVAAPVPAAYLLHGSVLCASLLGLFVGLYASLKRPVLAAVVTLLLAFYPPAHGSGGWDYHNTAAGAFYLWTFAFLAVPATLDGNRLMLAIAGALAAMTIHTNITFVNFLPALAFVHVSAATVRHSKFPSASGLAGRAAWVAAGALLATVVLGLVNREVGRQFIFFSPLLKIVVRFVGDPQNQESFHRPWSSGWLWVARYLSLPAAVSLVAAVSFVAGYWRNAAPGDRHAGALVIQFIAMLLLWIAWQTAGQTALDVDYFAYVLLPSCYIALGGMLSLRWPDWCERHWATTLVATALVLFAGLTVDPIPGARATAALIAQVSFVAIAALFCVGLAVALWRPGLVGLAVLLATFSFGNRLVGGSADYFWSDACKVQPSVYGAIVETASWLMTDVDPLYTRARIWFDEDEIIQPLDGCPVRLGHIALSATRTTSMSTVAPAFPLPNVENVPDEAIAGLASPDRILVIISSSPGHLREWDRRLAVVGLTHSEIGAHVVPVGSSNFTLHAWSVRATN